MLSVTIHFPKPQLCRCPLSYFLKKKSFASQWEVYTTWGLMESNTPVPNKALKSTRWIMFPQNIKVPLVCRKELWHFSTFHPVWSQTYWGSIEWRGETNPVQRKGLSLVCDGCWEPAAENLSATLSLIRSSGVTGVTLLHSHNEQSDQNQE